MTSIGGVLANLRGNAESPEPQAQPRRARNDNNDNDDDEDASTEEVIFALTPGTFETNILNYKKTSHIKLYKAATSKLPVEIDCSPKTMKLFLSSLEDRAMSYGWDYILNIPDRVNDPEGRSKNLLTEYGRISLSHIKATIESYINDQNRLAQDSMMLFICLKDSLTDTARAKILLHRDDYTSARGIVSGPMLLKVIIRESYNDTNATVKFIRSRLSSLDTYIKSIDSDIEKFNDYVQDQLMSLHARGEDTHDLLSHLFKGYAAASDRQFVAYIAKKEDDYDEGQNIEPHRLMELALNKYTTLLEGGEWNAPTEEETKIIALQAEVQKLKSTKKAGKTQTQTAKTGNKSNKSKASDNKTQKTKMDDHKT